MTIAALVLLVIKHRRAIYGDDGTQGLVLQANEAVRGMLLDVGEAAGVIVRHDSVASLVEDTRKKLAEAEDEWAKVYKQAHVVTAEKVADVKGQTEDGEAGQPEAVPDDAQAEQLAASAQQFNNKMQDIDGSLSKRSVIPTSTGPVRPIAVISGRNLIVPVFSTHQAGK